MRDAKSDDPTLEQVTTTEYRWGFVTDVESDAAPRGLSEDTVRFISKKKGEPAWLLDWRLKAYRHWLTLEEPTWPKVTYPKIDYQNVIYYSAPKSAGDRPKSLADVDPELLATYEKLGIPLREREALAGVAVDAVFDSVSVATSFKDKLSSLGIVFCSFSEAVREHPELVRKYLGSVVPARDNFFAALNTAVFSDGSFVYVPKGVRCPMELSTYFRINAADTGQFERTLIVADEGAYVSYLEGCTAPKRDTEPAARRGGRARGARRRRDQVLDRPELVPGRQGRPRGHLQLRHEARRVPRAPQQDLVDAGRDRLGHHLEVPLLHPPGRRQRRRVLQRGAGQPLPAGRHRHEDDPHRHATPAARSSRRASPRAGARTPTAASCASARAPRARATTRSATRS